MSKDCNYHNAEWCKRFDGLENFSYKTKIEGNTLYIISRAAERLPIYRKLFWKLYFRIREEKREPMQCALPMCKLKESALIDVLKSYGFDIVGE